MDKAGKQLGGYQETTPGGGESNWSWEGAHANPAASSWNDCSQQPLGHKDTTCLLQNILY